MRNTLAIIILICIWGNAFSSTKIQSKNKKIILVTSAECGYCIKNIAFYNQLSNEYKDKIPMIALYESTQEQINILPIMFPDKEVVLENWTVIPDAECIYMNLIDYPTYPQLLFVNNDIVVKRFVGTIDSVKKEIRDQLPLFIKE